MMRGITGFTASMMLLSSASSVIFTRRYCGRSGVADRVVFRNDDLFKVDISEATVVTLFLLEGLNLQLLPKLQRELKPGTRIVSHHFDMGDAWPAELTQDVGGLMIYMWTVR